MLVCDDGSTDASREAVRAIGDERVRWLPGARGGRPAIPRNRGIKASRGDWLAFLDNDDEWLPDKLKTQLELAGRLGCKAVCCNAQRLIPTQGVVGNYLQWSQEKVTFGDLLRVNHVICSSVLVHRSALTVATGFPEAQELKALEDYALWLRVASLTDFAYAATPLVLYRDDAGNSVRREDLDVWRQRRIVFEDFIQWSRANGADQEALKKVRTRLRWDRVQQVVTPFLATARRLKKAAIG